MQTSQCCTAVRSSNLEMLHAGAGGCAVVAASHRLKCCCGCCHDRFCLLLRSKVNCLGRLQSWL